jgi:hypothetical protein
MLYVLVCNFLDFEPTSLSLDRALSLPSHLAFAAKIALFAAFPAIVVAVALFSVCRVRRSATLTGIPVACVGVVVNLWMFCFDLSALWSLYRGYVGK